MGGRGGGGGGKRERKAIGKPFGMNFKIQPTVPPPQAFFLKICVCFAFQLFCFVLKCEFVWSVGWLAGLKSQM